MPSPPHRTRDKPDPSPNWRGNAVTAQQATGNQPIDMIRSLPEETTVNEFTTELRLKMKVDAGLKDLDEGKGMAHDQAKERLPRWLSK